MSLPGNDGRYHSSAACTELRIFLPNAAGGWRRVVRAYTPRAVSSRLEAPRIPKIPGTYNELAPLANNHLLTL